MVDCIVYGRTETCSAVVFKLKPLGVCAFAPNGGEGGLKLKECMVWMKWTRQESGYGGKGRGANGRSCQRSSRLAV